MLVFSVMDRLLNGPTGHIMGPRSPSSDYKETQKYHNKLYGYHKETER